MARSIFPSAFKSPAATAVAWMVESICRVGPWRNVPSPLFSRITTLLGTIGVVLKIVLVTTARSGLPSPVKSAVTRETGCSCPGE